MSHAMHLDPSAGLCVFEVVLGFRDNRKTCFSPLCLVQADDSDEAEDKVMDYLCIMDLDQDVWIDQMSDPFGISEYQERSGEYDDPPPFLEEMGEAELREFLGFYC